MSARVGVKGCVLTLYPRRVLPLITLPCSCQAHRHMAIAGLVLYVWPHVSCSIRFSLWPSEAWRPMPRETQQRDRHIPGPEILENSSSFPSLNARHSQDDPFVDMEPGCTAFVFKLQRINRACCGHAAVRHDTHRTCLQYRHTSSTG